MIIWSSLHVDRADEFEDKKQGMFMKLFRNEFMSLLLATAGFVPMLYGMHPQRLPQADLLRRQDFVQDIVGQSEQAFRAAFGWRNGFFTGRPPGGWARWAGPGSGRRRTISMIGDRGGSRPRPRIKTVHEWNGKIGARPQPLGRPRFVIKFHDPLDPELTDIRYM